MQEDILRLLVEVVKTNIDMQTDEYSVVFIKENIPNRLINKHAFKLPTIYQQINE